MLSTLLTNA